eukprot:TRINITY_DN5869_c0_g1_i3.p1 TRINITY_DN5869_c0_g1~~TRINITY_DN5869_c0_g1_i3.p1  ORF type:complete len:432 (-),score=63.59 TRINITY_DN5869_c0_g1_i3:117-1412(-)
MCIRDSTITDNNIPQIAKAVAALCSALDSNKRNQIQQKYLNQVKSGQEGNQTLLSLLTIGEIGKRIDLSSSNEVTQTLLSQFKSKNEDIRSYASTALGAISIGNVKHFIPIIIDQVKQSTQQENKILMLHALRELISQSSPQIYTEIKSILPFLFECTTIEQESFRNMVAECIGKIASVNPGEIVESLLQNLDNTNAFTRYTVATSVKYMAAKKIAFSTVLPLLMKLVTLLNDVNHDVQRSVILSISQVATMDYHALEFLNEDSFQNLFNCTKFRPDLVKEIIKGKFELKVDEGFKLRQAAYQFFENHMFRIYDKVNFHLLIDVISQGLDDQSTEIQLIAIRILEHIVQLAQVAIVGTLDILVPRIEKIVTKQKQNYEKKEQTENTKDLIRGITTCLGKIQKIPESESNQKFTTLNNQITNDQELKNLIDN